MQRQWMSGKAGPVAGLALFLAACSPSAGDQAANEADEAGDEVATASFVNRMAGAQPPAPPSRPFQQAEKTALLEFLYAWPAQASAVPQIADKLRKDMNSGKADALKMATEDRKSAQQSGFPFHAHSLETRWTVAADTPRFLSLLSSRYTYTGGAHGMTGYDVLLWDKARAKKRGGPILRGDDPFTKCIDPMKEVLVPTSRDGKLIDSIKVVIGPYSAGSYAEGTYEVPLPVGAAMLKAIKTEYQDAFAGAP